MRSFGLRVHAVSCQLSCGDFSAPSHELPQQFELSDNDGTMLAERVVGWRSGACCVVGGWLRQTRRVSARLPPANIAACLARRVHPGASMDAKSCMRCWCSGLDLEALTAGYCHATPPIKAPSWPSASNWSAEASVPCCSCSPSIRGLTSTVSCDREIVGSASGAAPSIV